MNYLLVSPHPTKPFSKKKKDRRISCSDAIFLTKWSVLCKHSISQFQVRLLYSGALRSPCIILQQCNARGWKNNRWISHFKRQFGFSLRAKKNTQNMNHIVYLRWNRLVVYLSVKCVLELADNHKYLDLVHLLYIILLHISVVQISHHQVEHGYTKE